MQINQRERPQKHIKQLQIKKSRAAKMADEFSKDTLRVIFLCDIIPLRSASSNHTN